MATAQRLLLRLPTEGIQMVTPEMAFYWLENCVYPGQRPVRDWQVRSLAKEMEQGRFTQKTMIHFCTLDHHSYLVNGQHTLSAMVRSGCSNLLTVIVTPCTDPEQVADIYARHDTHLTRRIHDSLVAHGIGAEFGVSSTQLNFMTAAIMLYAYMTQEISIFSATRVTNDEKLVLIRKHGADFVRALAVLDGFCGQRYRFMQGKPCLCAVRITLDYDAEIATDFWRTMLADDGLRAGDPRKALLTFLTNSRFGGSPVLGKRTLTPAHFLKGISYGWNAFMRNEELAFIKILNRKFTEVEFQGIGKFRI